MTFEEFRDMVNDMEIGNDVEVMVWDNDAEHPRAIEGYFMDDERVVFD